MNDMARKVTKYRDTKTGRFVSKGTWRRSHAHGGTRYRRNRVAQGGKPKKRIPRRPVHGLPPGAVPIPSGQPIPGGMFIPPEFLRSPDMFYGGEDYAEEAEY